MVSQEKIGRYLLERRLAVGGMAEIFLAKLVGPAGFEKEVVIKRILPQWSQDADFVAMLIDEAKIAVQLSHPNIVQVLELGREGETYYIAMEFVRGADLRRLLQKTAVSFSKRVPPEVALWIVCEALEGLGYAHEKTGADGHPLKIVHRDISPQNLLVSFDGHAKVTDFGIAKAASRGQETVAGVLKGKFAYMSPEQASQEDLDARSDLFSLAIVLYELLTGERLFYKGSDLDTLDRVRRGIVEFSPAASEEIPRELQAILLKALGKERDLRYPSASSFRSALIDCARHLGWDLRRERTASFLQNLFGEETRLIQVASTASEGLPKEDFKKLEPTKTVHREEILAQSETLFLPETTMSWAKIGAIAAAACVGFFWLWMLFANLRLTPSKPATPIEKVVVKTKPVLVEKPRPVPPEVPPPETHPIVAVLVEPAPAPKAETPLAPVAKLPPPKSGRGFLSVQAIPWGSVTVDGGPPRETPVRRLSLKEGTHTVRVAYAPDASVVTRAVRVVSDREIVCIAKFRGGKSLTCAE